MFLICGKVFSLHAEEVHELVKQALQIELLEIDEEHDGHKAKVACAFIVRIDREEREGY